MRKETDNYIYSPAKNSTHILQLADVLVFKPLKSEWKLTEANTDGWKMYPWNSVPWTFGPMCVCSVYVKAVSVNRNDYMEPSYTSYHVMKDAVADKLMLSRLAAFMSIATKLQPYLPAFQSDNPLMPFVCGELSSIVHALMKPSWIKQQARHVSLL